MSDLALLVAFTVLGSASVAFVVWFNRDPERHPPNSGEVIVSPADGRIIYVKSFGKGEAPVSVKFGRETPLDEIESRSSFPSGGYLVGIRLSPLDVHVNRSPISGTVRMIRHKPGRLFSIRPPRILEEAERNTLIIGNGQMSVGVIQMAAYLVRRTVVEVPEGFQVRMGQRIGCIRLGSQVDLLIPNEQGLSLCVKTGMCLRAGESVVATSGGGGAGAVHGELV